MNILGLPTVLVARGCLAPYFLGWWQRTPAPLYICDFSRWRWFEFGEAARPRWLGYRPPVGPVVLFDRNTTTGQTLRLLKKWLEADGYEVVVLGHLDYQMGRFGLRYLDFIWNDGEGYDRLGLACQAQNGVRIVPVSEFKTELVGGAYTFCVIGGEIAELGGLDARQFLPLDLRAKPIPSAGSVVFCHVPSWEEAMILGYINQKPLITVATQPGIAADYRPGDDISEVVSFLREEEGR